MIRYELFWLREDKIGGESEGDLGRFTRFQKKLQANNNGTGKRKKKGGGGRRVTSGPSAPEREGEREGAGRR